MTFFADPFDDRFLALDVWGLVGFGLVGFGLVVFGSPSDSVESKSREVLCLLILEVEGFLILRLFSLPLIILTSQISLGGLMTPPWFEGMRSWYCGSFVS